MIKLLFKYRQIIIAIGDGIIINYLFLQSAGISYSKVHASNDKSTWLIVLAVNLAWLASSLVQKRSPFHKISEKLRLVRQSIRLMVFHFLLLYTFIGIMGITIELGRVLYPLYLPGIGLIVLWRYVLYEILKRLIKNGYGFKKVIIIGSGDEALNMGRVFVEHPEFGYQFRGYFDNLNLNPNQPLKGSIDDAFDYFLQHNIDEIYCAISSISNEEGNRLIALAENNFRKIRFIPLIKPEEQLQKYSIEYFDNLPIMVMPELPLEKIANKFIKRLSDIVVSSFVILFILSWLIPIISLMILIDSKGPIFYRQKRSGINNTIFWCWKFRSMYTSKNSEFIQATQNDSRITAIGAFLRKTNLDELPQFFNVLSGNMSIIGPRPHPIELDTQYLSSISMYKRRMSVKPGITGLAQVRGYRGETQESYMMKNRVKMDIFYFENWSVLFDIKIFIMTILYTFKGDSKAY